MFLALHGPHQGENAAIALAAAEAFLGRPLDAGLVAEAFSMVRNPGRFEVVARDPLLILDGAHNPDGADAASEALLEGFAVPGETRLVLGTLAGRDPEPLLEAFGVRDASLVVCCTPASPRAVPAADLASMVTSLGGTAAVVPDVGEALRHALDGATAIDAVIVTGSLYTVGAARAECRRLGLVADR